MAFLRLPGAGQTMARRVAGLCWASVAQIQPSRRDNDANLLGRIGTGPVALGPNGDHTAIALFDIAGTMRWITPIRSLDVAPNAIRFA